MKHNINLHVHNSKSIIIRAYYDDAGNATGLERFKQTMGQVSRRTEPYRYNAAELATLLRSKFNGMTVDKVVYHIHGWHDTVYCAYHYKPIAAMHIEVKPYIVELYIPEAGVIMGVWGDRWGKDIGAITQAVESIQAEIEQGHKDSESVVRVLRGHGRLHIDWIREDDPLRTDYTTVIMCSYRAGTCDDGGRERATYGDSVPDMGVE